MKEKDEQYTKQQQQIKQQQQQQQKPTHFLWVSDRRGFHFSVCTVHTDRLVGLVVKASASRAGGPGFESR